MAKLRHRKNKQSKDVSVAFFLGIFVRKMSLVVVDKLRKKLTKHYRLTKYPPPFYSF